MRYFEDEISGIDGSTATFVGYCLDNSSEIDPNRKRPSVLVIPGGGYEMTSDREAEPIAMQFLAAGFNAFVLRYSVKPSIFPVALLEAAEAMRRIRTHADEWHCDADAIAVIGFSAGGHLAANLATSASDDVLAAHGYDADAVRPNGLMLAYPVVTSGPLAHRGSFDALLGDRKADPEALDAVSIEKHIDAKTPPVFVWHTVPDDCVPYENTLMLVDACKKAGVSVEAHCSPTAATVCHSAPPKPHGRGSTASNRACRSGRNLRSRGCVVHLRIPTLPRPALPQPTRLPNNRHSCVFFRVFSRLFCRTTSLFGPKNQVVRHLIE